MLPSPFAATPELREARAQGTQGVIDGIDDVAAARSLLSPTLTPAGIGERVSMCARGIRGFGGGRHVSAEKVGERLPRERNSSKRPVRCDSAKLPAVHHHQIDAYVIVDET